MGMPTVLALAHLALCALFALPQEGAEGLWRQGERARALEVMERELALRPGDRALRRLLVERELSVQRFASALAHAEGLGEDGDALRGRALYFLARYEEALPLLSPAEPELVVLRVEALHKLGRFEEERAAIDAAIDVLGAEHRDVLPLRARAAEAAGDLALAAELHGAVLALDDLDARALFGRGRALLRIGEREEGRALLERHRALVPLLDALEFAERGLDLGPLHAPNHAALGDAWRALVPHSASAYARAEAAYARASELATAAERAPIALRHARLLAEDGADLEGAVALLSRAEERARDPRLPVRRGDLLLSAGRRGEARAAYARALELAPGDPAVIARLRALEEEPPR